MAYIYICFIKRNHEKGFSKLTEDIDIKKISSSEIESFRFVYYSFFTLYSCQKEKVTEAPKPLTINRIFSEDTHGDNTKVYTNDSLFCLYLDDHNFKVWKNGILLKDHEAILPLIMKNDSTKQFRTYRFQSELMKLDFNNYSSKTLNRDTKDYQIRKREKIIFCTKKDIVSSDCLFIILNLWTGSPSIVWILTMIRFLNSLYSTKHIMTGKIRSMEK